MNHKTTLVTAHLFKLKNPQMGFEPENRFPLLTVPHSVQSGSSLKQFIQTKNKCDPLMPLRFYDEKLTFYELQFFASEKVKELYTDTGIPKHLLKNNYQKMSPLQLAQFYQQKSSDIDTFVEEMNNMDDPDKEYFNFIGAEFIDYVQRRKNEAEEPYVYISYSTSEVNGCDHYYRDAFPVCKICNKVYPCRFCHDDEVFDHRMDRKLFTDMQCLFCNEIGPIGTHCSKCGKQVSNICCQTCHTLCQIPNSVKPAYHCDECGLCRVGLKEYSKHCQKCNSCYDSRNQSEHKCVDSCTCPVCQQDLSETITPEFSLKCDPRHRIHAACYDQLLHNGTFVCPLDHKIIIDDDQYAMLRGKVYHIYRSNEINYYGDEQLIMLKKAQCYDCNKYSYDVYVPQVPQICHRCFGVNTKDVTEIFSSAKSLQGDIDGTVEELHALQDKITRDADDIDEAVEYLRRFRTINKELVPKIVQRIPNQEQLMQLLQMMMRQQ
ncbi:CHY_zinc finger domain-containing protein [Hexamita inflata]|uniref:CHY zinc finger domain-containing protein n=1 Tax=Hexamita inflata TaxID=28002 RepID=A0AA86R490_9EUKA|nr:CHY zinc finger domain-containing protein [Hexamita inflata]